MLAISSTTAARLLTVSKEVRSEREALFLSIARVGLFATLLLAPLAFGAVQAWAWASLAVLAVVLLFLWALGQVERRKLSIAWSPIYLPAGLFLIFGLIQFSARLTLDPIATRESLIKLVTVLIFFFLAGQLFASASRAAWRRFGLAVTLFAFALALFAILQFFSSHGLIYWVVRPQWGGYVFGPYVNHNHYAGLMEMLIPVAAGYALSRPANQPLRALLGFTVLVPIASLLLSGSRGGFVSLTAETAILGAILLRHGRLAGQPSWVAPAVVSITLAGLLFFWMDPGDISKRLATVAEVTQAPEATLGERKAVAVDSLRILRDHPWLGAGLGSFETAYPRYQSFPAGHVYDHAHNDYAEALAETGLVGGILIVVALGLFLRLAFKNLGERLRHQAGWIQFGGTLGCCGLLVHSSVDFNLHIPANAAWFAVCAALGTSLTTRPRERARQTLPDTLR
jgi:O-antigen ligase